MYKSKLHMFLSIALTVSGFALGSFIGLRSKESRRADALIHEVNILSGQLADAQEELFTLKTKSISVCHIIGPDENMMSVRARKGFTRLFSQGQEILCN